MKESVIEKRLVKGVKELGGKCLKMVPTYDNGIPDRLVLYGGEAIFVEVKRPGKEPRKLQVLFAEELRRNGFTVKTLDSIEQVDIFVNNLSANNFL